MPSAVYLTGKSAGEARGYEDNVLELGFNIAEPNIFDEVARSPAPRFDLAANPYSRTAKNRLSISGWGGPSLPSVSLLGNGGAGSSFGNAVDAATYALLW
jgi:hypothetical protein